jgi:polyhydroxyalkanoate synthesis regulator protein
LVLTQIIFEQENKEGQNLLPITFLRQLIRFYGDSMQMLVPRYLEVSIESLTKEQEKFRSQMAQAFGGLGALEDQVRRNMEIFKRTFAMFTPPFARGAAGSGGEGEKPQSEIDDLKRRLSEMQKRLETLTTGGRSEQAGGEIDDIKRQLGEMQQRLEQLTGVKE